MTSHHTKSDEYYNYYNVLDESGSEVDLPTVQTGMVDMASILLITGQWEKSPNNDSIQSTQLHKGSW